MNAQEIIEKLMVGNVVFVMKGKIVSNGFSIDASKIQYKGEVLKDTKKTFWVSVWTKGRRATFDFPKEAVKLPDSRLSALYLNDELHIFKSKFENDGHKTIIVPDVERVERLDVGWGDDGNDWISDEEHTNLITRLVKKYKKKSDRVIKELESLGLRASFSVEISDKGFVTLVFDWD